MTVSALESAGAISTISLPNNWISLPSATSLRSVRYFIQSKSAEKKMSAGAPSSICLARAELAA